MSQIPQPPGSVRPHRGAMILVFGILGMIVCVIFGILAWIMGGGDLKMMRAGQMDNSGYGLTQAGWILGIIGTCLGLLGLVIAIFWIIFAVLLAAGAAGAAGGP